MTYDKLVIMLDQLDDILNQFENMTDDKFEIVQDAYLHAFHCREMMRLQEIEYFRSHLERSFLAS